MRAFGFAMSMLCFATIAAIFVSCNGATFTPAPDSGAAHVCPTAEKAVVFCDAGPPGSVGCTVMPSDTGHVTLIPPQPFAAGCTANILAPGVDINGECKLDSVCTCEAVPDAAANVPPTWTCAP